MPEPERTKVRVPRSTINRIKELERVIEMAEDRVLKVRNLRTALSTVFPESDNRLEAEYRKHLLNLVGAALASLDAVKHRVEQAWHLTLPEEAIGLDDLEDEDA